MGSKLLLNENQKTIFKDRYHSFILNKRRTDNRQTLEDFFEIIKGDASFNNFTSQQLSNQIIAFRRTDGVDNWPRIEEYESYISIEARSFIKKSISSCLLAVEVYNKPTVGFRTENYIVLMMISWTSAFHALFHEKEVAYKDNENKYFSLSRCITIYKQKEFSFEAETITQNISFLYELRNEITHRSAHPLDEDVFGECQACLLNFQDFLFHFWGEQFQLGYSLAHSLQFSRSIRKNKLNALKKYEVSKIESIKDFIDEYRKKLNDEKPSIANDLRFSFKVFMIPKLASKDRNADLALEFIKFSDLDTEEGSKKYEKVLLAIKEINSRYYRPKEIAKKIKEFLQDKYDKAIKFSPSYHHARCTKYYKIHEGKGTNQPHRTRTEYSRYNPTYNLYEYTEEWITFLKKNLTPPKLKEIISNINGRT